MSYFLVVVQIEHFEEIKTLYLLHDKRKACAQIQTCNCIRSQNNSFKFAWSITASRNAQNFQDLVHRVVKGTKLYCDKAANEFLRLRYSVCS